MHRMERNCLKKNHVLVATKLKAGLLVLVYKEQQLEKIWLGLQNEANRFFTRLHTQATQIVTLAFKRGGGELWNSFKDLVFSPIITRKVNKHSDNSLTKYVATHNYGVAKKTVTDVPNKILKKIIAENILSDTESAWVFSNIDKEIEDIKGDEKKPAKISYLIDLWEENGENPKEQLKNLTCLYRYPVVS